MVMTSLHFDKTTNFQFENDKLSFVWESLYFLLIPKRPVFWLKYFWLEACVSLALRICHPTLSWPAVFLLRNLLIATLLCMWRVSYLLLLQHFLSLIFGSLLHVLINSSFSCIWVETSVLPTPGYWHLFTEYGSFLLSPYLFKYALWPLFSLFTFCSFYCVKDWSLHGVP